MHRPTKPDRESEGMPRWVALVLIGLVVAALLVLVVMLLTDGGHRPMQHGAADPSVYSNADFDRRA